MNLTIPAILLLVNFQVAAQTNQTPCSSSEAAQFDFWVGEWDLTWNDTSHGTNHIEKMYGNCTINEHFADPNTNYLGQSWSVYNPASHEWQQTWIDNQGGYIALKGSWQGDRMVLKTPEMQGPAGKRQMRMVYYNIKPDAFDWSWEASTDGGISWKPNWKIHYDRKH